MSKAHRPAYRNPKTGKLLENREQVCPACFENFRGTEAGERHRIGDFATGRSCRSGLESGLIQISNKFSTLVWTEQK